jgi:hypothetical protein
VKGVEWHLEEEKRRVEAVAVADMMVMEKEGGESGGLDEMGAAYMWRGDPIR